MGYRYRDKSWSDWGCLGWCLALLLVIGLFWLEIQIACWLWGVIMVGVFSLPALTGWQMFGLMVLANLVLPTSHISIK